ncbi:MAG: hypothetical protein ACI8SR_002841 [Oceanicoccus sp.]|jgi:hypothetical protein
MIRLLVCTMTLLLCACVSNSPKEMVYLSEPETINKLMEIRYLDHSIEQVSKDLTASSKESYIDELTSAFKAELLISDFKEYLLMNLPQSNATAWVDYYSSDFQMQIAKLEDDMSGADENPDFQSEVLAVKQNKKLMEEIDDILNLMDIEDKIRSIFYNGLLKPMFYGMALSNNKGGVIEQEKLDEAINVQVAQFMPEALEGVKDISYYAYSKLNAPDRLKLKEYYQSPVSEYYDSTIVAAFSHSLSKASNRFVASLSKKFKTTIQTARFDEKSCLEVQKTHVCEILKLNSQGRRESLYTGTSVLGKSEKYRIMAPNDNWQKVVPSVDYKGDLIVSRKDGEAIFSVTYLADKSFDAKAYRDDSLGDVAKAINEEPTLVNLRFDPSLRDVELYEICFNYFEVDVCKIAGEALLDGTVIQVDAFYVYRDTEIQEIINILTSIEKIQPISQ